MHIKPYSPLPRTPTRTHQIIAMCCTHISNPPSTYIRKSIASQPAYAYKCNMLLGNRSRRICLKRNSLFGGALLFDILYAMRVVAETNIETGWICTTRDTTAERLGTACLADIRWTHNRICSIPICVCAFRVIMFFYALVPRMMAHIDLCWSEQNVDNPIKIDKSSSQSTPKQPIYVCICLCG